MQFNNAAKGPIGGRIWHGFAFKWHSGHASTGMFVKIVSAFPACVASAFLAFSLVGVAPFEGEFSDVTRSYAGKGVVLYTW